MIPQRHESLGDLLGSWAVSRHGNDTVDGGSYVFGLQSGGASCYRSCSPCGEADTLGSGAITKVFARMKQKTYLTPAQQWDRTVAVYTKFDPDATFGPKYPDCYLGQALLPQRLLCPGDMFIMEITNGSGERWCVWCVSSKGAVVRRRHMKFQSWYAPKKQEYVIREYLRPTSGLVNQFGRAFSVFELDKKTRGFVRRNDGYVEQFPIPERKIFFELPDELVGRRPIDPAVRGYVLDTLRAGDADQSGKRG